MRVSLIAHVSCCQVFTLQFLRYWQAKFQFIFSKALNLLIARQDSHFRNCCIFAQQRLLFISSFFFSRTIFIVVPSPAVATAFMVFLSKLTLPAGVTTLRSASVLSAISAKDAFELQRNLVSVFCSYNMKLDARRLIFVADSINLSIAEDVIVEEASPSLTVDVISWDTVGLSASCHLSEPSSFV